MLLIGMTVGMADGALLAKLADEKRGEVEGEELERVTVKGLGHTVTAVVVGLLGVGWLSV